MKIRTQPALAPGLDSYVYIEWDKRTREPSVILGGGLSEDTDLPDLAERFAHLSGELVKRNKNRKNG